MFDAVVQSFITRRHLFPLVLMFTQCLCYSNPIPHFCLLPGVSLKAVCFSLFEALHFVNLLQYHVAACLSAWPCKSAPALVCLETCDQLLVSYPVLLTGYFCTRLNTHLAGVGKKCIIHACAGEWVTICSRFGPGGCDVGMSFHVESGRSRVIQVFRSV